MIHNPFPYILLWDCVHVAGSGDPHIYFHYKLTGVTPPPSVFRNIQSAASIGGDTEWERRQTVLKARGGLPFY